MIEEHLAVCQKARSFEDRLALKAQFAVLRLARLHPERAHMLGIFTARDGAPRSAFELRARYQPRVATGSQRAASPHRWRKEPIR